MLLIQRSGFEGFFITEAFLSNIVDTQYFKRGVS